MALRGAVAVTAVALTLGAGADVADAGPPGRWTRVTGVGQPVASTLEVGVARTPDGVLHVLWTREARTAGSVLHSTVSADARRVGAPRPVAAYQGGVNDSVALLAVPGGLRAFFAGLQAGSPVDRVMATATFARRAWSPAVPASNTASGRTPYAAAGVAAGVGLDGTPVSAWGSPGSGFHVGLDPAAPDGSLPGRTATDPGVGVDSVGGRVVVAWNLLDEGGVAAISVSSPGARKTIPGSRAAQLQHRVGVTGRIGASGVYVAYIAGDNQFTGRPAVWRFGAGRGRPVSRTTGARDICVAPAPGGRLWVFWHRDGRLFATRSDPAATRFGAVVSLDPPRGTRSLHDLAGEGSRGPLDLMVLLTRARTDTANWHQRVLPGLTLSVVAARPGLVTFRVLDAGVPVAGARVSVAGAGSRRTRAGGLVSLRLARGSHRATAAKRGYTTGSVLVRAR
jgi:hypothetical protein